MLGLLRRQDKLEATLTAVPAKVMANPLQGDASMPSRAGAPIGAVDVSRRGLRDG